MPDVGYASYILDYLFEVGLHQSGGMSIAPVSWAEIQAWSQLACVRLTKFEAQTIRALSKSFVDQYDKSNDTLVPSPYQPAVMDQAAIGKRIGETLRGIAARSRAAKSSKNKTQGPAI